MKLARTLLALLGVLALPEDGTAQQKISRRIPIDPEASIRIYNLAGNTRLIGWEQDSIVVTGTAAPRCGGSRR